MRICVEESGVPFVQINIGFLADQVGITTTDTLYLGQGVHDLLLAINVGVEQSQDELEVRFFGRDQRCEAVLSVSCLATYEAVPILCVNLHMMGNGFVEIV